MAQRSLVVWQCQKTYLFWDNSSETKIDEDESIELSAVANVIEFDIVMNDIQRMQFRQVLKQIAFDSLLVVLLRRVLLAHLHWKFYAVEIYYYVVAHFIVDSWANLQMRCQLYDAVLFYYIF